MRRGHLGLRAAACLIVFGRFRRCAVNRYIRTLPLRKAPRLASFPPIRGLQTVHEAALRRRARSLSLVWWLTSLQQRLVKTGGRLIKHARYWLLLAETHLTRRLFGGMLRTIVTLQVPAG